MEKPPAMRGAYGAKPRKAIYEPITTKDGAQTTISTGLRDRAIT